MKYRIALSFFILVPGQVDRNFELVLNEMGPGWSRQAWYFHTPDIPIKNIVNDEYNHLLIHINLCR